jgi:hypothetical protein
MASPKNRPTGIVVIAVLWTIGGIIGIGSGLNALAYDLGIMPLLSDPSAPEWYRFGIQPK